MHVLNEVKLLELECNGHCSLHANGIGRSGPFTGIISLLQRPDNKGFLVEGTSPSNAWVQGVAPGERVTVSLGLARPKILSLLQPEMEFFPPQNLPHPTTELEEILILQGPNNLHVVINSLLWGIQY